MTEHTPRITDDEVARLSIDAGRADLLEEIMATPVDQLDRTADRRTDRGRRRPAPAWFAVPAAAAAIAAIALVPALRSDDTSPGNAPVAGGPSSSPTSDTAQPDVKQPAPDAPAGVRSVPGGKYVALDAGGWTVTYVYEGENETDVAYGREGRSFEMVQYPAEYYDTYYEDRLGVSKPAPGRLLGEQSATFTYSADDHATIRPAENGQFLEVRGSGMGLAAYHALLEQVVQTDERGFAASLPEGVVTPFNTEDAVTHLLDGVEVPDGFTAADVDIDGFNDAYQSAAKVAGSVGCAWLDVYAGGTPAARQRALAALDGSTGWPLLEDIADQGGYSDVFWGVADQLRDGQPVAQIRQGIC